MDDPHLYNNSYLLWKRFLLPVEHGTIDSFAVELGTGSTLVAVYTLMFNLIITQLFALTVFAGVLYSEKKNHWGSHDSETDSTSTSILDFRDSALHLLKLMIEHLWRSTLPRQLSLLWALTAAAFLVLQCALPIFIARHLVIAHAAPVAPEAIYMPHVTNRSIAVFYECYALRVAAYLRAAGSVNSATQQKVAVDSPSFLLNEDGKRVVKIGYGYNVTGVDFGLQLAPELQLKVQGSCVTEYGWLVSNSTPDHNGWIMDSYILWNNFSNPLNVSIYDGGPPQAFFMPSDNPKYGSNKSYAIIPSSVDRASFTAGTDPWYQTVEDGLPNPHYRVLNGRPPLSCWENAVWFYKGNKGSIYELSNFTGLNLSEPLQEAFGYALGGPMIIQMGLNLGTRALRSSYTALEDIFDANSSSVHDDLKQLVLASYIATTKVLEDTTTYGPRKPDIPDFARNEIGTIKDGAGSFVIYSKNVATLPLKMVILIPLVLAFLFALVLFVASTSAIKSAYKKGLAHHRGRFIDPEAGAKEPGPQFEKDSLVAASEHGQYNKKDNLGEAANKA